MVPSAGASWLRTRMAIDLDNVDGGVLCHGCGYDLRAHPDQARCPECGESVAEARRLAAVPGRPKWADSDPRWRRRLLAGLWLLVFLPVMDFVRAFGWASKLPVPQVFDFRGVIQSLDDTLLARNNLFQIVLFTSGAVLLFSRERGLRASRLDWTRRWGILCSYVSFLLSISSILFVASLVLIGIGAVFLRLPAEHQPAATKWIVTASSAYMLYGAHPMTGAGLTLIASSATAVLFACVPLFAALRSAGAKRAAAILVAPLALFAATCLLRVGLSFFVNDPTLFEHELFFRPKILAEQIAEMVNRGAGFSVAVGFWVEAAKWCAVLTIAIWLSVARIRAKGRVLAATITTHPSATSTPRHA